MFEIGTVLRLFVEDTVPPKVKYCIIVGKSSDKIATIFINTEVNARHLPKDLQGCHFPLTPDDCRCLTQDVSYADCSQIREREKSDLNTLLQKEPGRTECILPEEKIKAIIAIVAGARTISPAQKKNFSIG